MTESKTEKQIWIDTQIAEFLKNGYKLEDLFISPTGSVIFDPTAAEEREFGKKSNDE